MLVSVSWLKKYVDIPVDTQTLAHDITMLGLNVEHVSGGAAIDPNVVIGRVLEVTPHPNADRLRVCRVDVGGESELEIVCGAPNVAAGQTVPVALVGAKLAGGLKIRKSKIRGVASNGMICSEIELGIGDDAEGIMVLEGDFSPGTRFGDVTGGEETLEIEVTPNRPDQLSHVGVAREIGALYDAPVNLPQSRVEVPGVDPCFSVTIAEPDDCYRFTGRVIRGVTVGPSPGWLRQALESVGLHSINNIVDVSNFVMMEMGQPTHAYDLHRLPARRMGVRRAREGERLRCLDEEEYVFRGGEILIVDADEPVGVGGVIGGYDTRVTGETTDVLIEAAAFDPRVVRRTRSAMNISTEASYRFERGSDRTAAAWGSERVAGLILEVAGGEAGEFIDIYPTRPEPLSVTIRRANTRRLLGLSLGVDDIASLLGRLGFEIEESDAESVTVRVPSYRGDILEEADLVEEVARLHGYDKIGEGWGFRTTVHASIDPFDEFVETVCDHLCARGHTEVLLSAFSEGTEADLAGWERSDPRRRFVEIVNPLTTLHGHLRTSLLPGLLQVARRNIDRGTRHLDIFSSGRVFLAGDGGGLPEEPRQLIIARSHPGAKDFWRYSKEATDLFDIKQEVEVLLERFGADSPGRYEYRFDARTGAFSYNDGRRAIVEGGIVPARLSDAYDLDQPVWYAVADLRALFESRRRRPTYEALGEYPVSKRDLSLVTPAGVSYAQIEKSLAKHGGRLLESTGVFDVFQGGNLPEGSTAYGVRLFFRSSEGTLTDADVDAVLARIIDKLQSELGVVLRS